MTTAQIASAATPPFEVISEILRARKANLQMLPQVAQHALEVAKNANCLINEFVGIVERDIKLASDILRLANSAAMGRGRAVDSLHQAVTRLGFQQCKNLIITNSVSSLMKKLPIEQEWVRTILWQHGFVTGLFALHLNRALNIGFNGEEFTAGLIHDVGRALSALAFPDQFSGTDQLDFLEDKSTPDAERRVLGIDHCELGAWFAKQNDLPESIVCVIRFHHDPASGCAGNKLLPLVAAADDLANHFQRHGEGAGFIAEKSQAFKHFELMGNPLLSRRFVEICPTLFNEVVSHVDELVRV